MPLINLLAGLLKFGAFDIGADKKVLFQECTGENPSLVVRGIRQHLLGQAEEFRAQQRAIIHAGAKGHAGILIPMVTTIDDVVEVKRHFVSVKNELRKSGLAFSENVTLGAMIENRRQPLR